MASFLSPLAVWLALGAAAVALSACALLTPLPKQKDVTERLAAFPTAGLPLDAPVTIHWSEQQIPFIEAESDGDAAFALGLVHAHLRLGQMATMRMIARGRVSEMIGPMGVDIDHGLRTLAYGRAAAEIERGMDADTRMWVQRFVDGVNHYQDTAAELPHDFDVLGLEPEPWTVEDVFAMGRLAGTDVNWLV
ncbi:MAG: penicillin acylase family protein, partial [Rhodospirillaceae bacterium]|nr:penicillin acylase family protein [Rhodospirillaceae bacterium]